MIVEMSRPRPQKSGYPRCPGFLGLNQQPLYQQCKLNSKQERESDTLLKVAELQGHSGEGNGTLRGANEISNAVRYFYKGFF